MSKHLEASAEAWRPPLGRTALMARFALIGLILASVFGTFAYLGGWLTPNALPPARFTDGFQEVFGVHPGFRRNHAKGVGVSGFFESNGNGVRLSKAAVFQPSRVPVLGRFSLGGGNPFAPDTGSAPHGLWLQFSLPDGELWRTAMLHLPVFPFRTPEAFYDQLFAFRPDPSTGQPDPATHPDLQGAQAAAVRRGPRLRRSGVAHPPLVAARRTPRSGRPATISTTCDCDLEHIRSALRAGGRDRQE